MSLTPNDSIDQLIFDATEIGKDLGNMKIKFRIAATRSMAKKNEAIWESLIRSSNRLCNLKKIK